MDKSVPLLVALLFVTVALAGCTATAEPGPLQSASEQSSQDAEAPATPTAASPPVPVRPAPEASQAPAAEPRLVPYVISGYLVGPEPGTYDSGVCLNYSFRYSETWRGISWQAYELNQSVDGWSFFFDVEGVAVGASQRFSSIQPSSGTIRGDPTQLMVCSIGAVNVEFKLTLLPPEVVIFTGHITLPDAGRIPQDFGHCHDWVIAAYDYVLSPHMTDVIQFTQDFSGWSFRFNVPGLVADFHPAAEDARTAASGTVVGAPDEVYICSRKAIDTDFVLILTPPA